MNEYEDSSFSFYESLNIGIRAFVSGNQGGRRYMEDEYTIVHGKSSYQDNKLFPKSFAFFGIFDGHGGDMAARYVRDNLCKNIICQKYFWSDNDDHVCLAIHRGYLRTQKAMMKEVGKWPKTNLGFPSTSGTTASILFIINGKYYTGHVGDSRIVLGRKVKELDYWRSIPMTRDHKPDSIKEMRRIEKTGGQVMNKSGIVRVVWKRPRRNLFDGAVSELAYDSVPFLSVARSLGDLWSLNKKMNKFIVSPEPDVRCIPIHPLDKCLILASDGLWNVIDMSLAIKFIQEFEEDNDSVEDWSNEFNENKHSPSTNLLHISLNLWGNSRFRADNTTILVVILDKKEIELPDTPIEELPICGMYGIVRKPQRLFGQTIHSFNFDKEQTSLNFTDIITEEEEIEKLIKEMIDKIEFDINGTTVNNDFDGEIDSSFIESTSYIREKCFKTSSNSYNYSFIINGKGNDKSNDNEDTELSKTNTTSNINNINTIEPMISNLSIQQSQSERMQLSLNLPVNDYYSSAVGPIDKNLGEQQHNMNYASSATNHRNDHRNDNDDYSMKHLYDYHQYNSVSNNSCNTHQLSVNENNNYNFDKMQKCPYKISNQNEINPKRKFDITNNDSGVSAGDIGSLSFPTGNTLKRHRNSRTFNDDNDVIDKDYDNTSDEENPDSDSTALDLSLNTISNNDEQPQENDHCDEGHFVGNTSINSEINSHDNYSLSDLHSKANGVDDSSYLNQYISN